MTFGELAASPDDPRLAEFWEAAMGVFADAGAAEGHLATAAAAAGRPGLDEDELDWGPWAPYRVPGFYRGSRERGRWTHVQTLTLWQDLDSVYAFSYSGRHLDAFRRREAWMAPPVAPSYVAWWIGDDHLPSWDEACERLEHLHAHGPTPDAFDFRRAFDAVGSPLAMGRAARAERSSGSA